MDKRDYRVADGSCIISEEVIAGIVANAALEVPGVAAIASKPKNIRGLVGNAPIKAVKVYNDENETILDVYLLFTASANVPEVASNVQRAVKSAVQSMTGKPVTKVNVHVMGIAPEKENNN